MKKCLFHSRSPAFAMVLSFVLFLVLVFTMHLLGCSVAEPSGILTSIIIGTDNTTSAHATTHENSGDDEISVIGLTGLLADDQHILDVEAVAAIEAANPLTLPTFTMGGDILTNDNYFDAGNGWNYFRNDGGSEGFYMVNDTDSQFGLIFSMFTDSQTPDDNDQPARFRFLGRDSAQNQVSYGWWNLVIDDVTQGTVDSHYYWVLMDNGATNTVMELSGAGILYVDDSYDTFDEHDDAKLLDEGIRGGNKVLLEEAGILKKKYKINENGEITNIQDGYMISIQNFTKLLAGGVYQNRDKVDALQVKIDALENRITELEK